MGREKMKTNILAGRRSAISEVYVVVRINNGSVHFIDYLSMSDDAIDSWISFLSRSMREYFSRFGDSDIKKLHREIRRHKEGGYKVKLSRLVIPI